MRTNYIESNFEEDIDIKYQYKIKNLRCNIENNDDACKSYVDSGLNDRSINRSKAHIDLKDRNFTNARFIQVIQLPQIDSPFTAKLYDDNPIDESSLVKNIQNNNIDNSNLTKINSFILNTRAVNGNQVITKAYVDQFHQENDLSRRDLGYDFYEKLNDSVKSNQANDLNDNKLTNLDSITFNRNPTSDNEVAFKKQLDDSKGNGNVLRFNQTIETYLNVSVGTDTYNLTKK